MVIRPYTLDDFDAVTRLWRAARELAFPDFQREKGHTFAEDCDYFRNVISQNNDIWVATAKGISHGIRISPGDSDR